MVINMSTRAQIIIKNEVEELWFYRHSDGYPSVTLQSLNRFLKWVKEGKLRDNPSQSAGWLILLGAQERKTKKEPTLGICGWEVGAYEPCVPNSCGGIVWEYIIDLDKKEITYRNLLES